MSSHFTIRLLRFPCLSSFITSSFFHLSQWKRDFSPPIPALVFPGCSKSAPFLFSTLLTCGPLGIIFDTPSHGNPSHVWKWTGFFCLFVCFASLLIALVFYMFLPFIMKRFCSLHFISYFFFRPLQVVFTQPVSLQYYYSWCKCWDTRFISNLKAASELTIQPYPSLLSSPIPTPSSSIAAVVTTQLSGFLVSLNTGS